jgi:hypothetical protein
MIYNKHLKYAKCDKIWKETGNSENLGTVRTLEIYCELDNELNENEIKIIHKLIKNMKNPMNNKIRNLIDINWEKILMKFKENSYLKITDNKNSFDFLIFSKPSNSWFEIKNNFEQFVKNQFLKKENKNIYVSEIERLINAIELPKEYLNPLENLIKKKDCGINEIRNIFFSFDKIVAEYVRYDFLKYLKYGLLCQLLLRQTLIKLKTSQINDTYSQFKYVKLEEQI